MKKLFSALLAIVICLSMTVSSFAAVTSMMRFFDEDTGNVVLFGKFEDGDAEVGFEVDGKQYPLENMDTANNMFGIGLFDKNNKLGDTYEAIPYAKDAEGNITRGEAITVENPVLDNALLSDIKINGATIPEFASEKDYYYYNVTDASAIDETKIEVTTAKAYTETSIEKSGSNYVIKATAPDASKTTEIRVRANREYADNLSVPVTGAELIEINSDGKLGAIQFDISNIKSINDTAYFTVNIAKATTDSKLCLYGLKDNEAALENISLTNESIGEYIAATSLSAEEEQNKEDLKYISRTYNVTDYITNKIEKGENTATIIFALEAETAATVYIATERTNSEGNTIFNTKLDFSNWKGALKTLTVGGKAVPEFYTGTLETEFFFGLDELPDTASELPEIVAEAFDGTTNVEIKEIYAGYLAEITVESNGITKLIKLYIRKFSEVTRTIESAEYMFDVREGYISEGKHFTGGFSYIYLKKVTEKMADQDSRMAYITYTIPSIEGYAPAGYDMKGIRAYTCQKYGSSENPCDCKTHGITVYAYDGNLDGFDPSTLSSGVSVKDNNNAIYPYLAQSFKGYNPSEAFTVHQFNEVKDYNKNQTAFSSVSVKEGQNIIIYQKTDYDLSHNTHSQQMIYNSDYRMPITVKYVEKFPADPADKDASLKSIKVNGEKVSGFDSAKTEYYIGVSDTSSAPLIEAASMNANASITVTPISGEQTVEIKVVSKDGSENKTYYVYYREIKEKTISPASVIAAFPNYGTLDNYRVRRFGETITTTNDQDMLQYQLYSIGKDSVLISLDEISGNISTKGQLSFYSYSLDDIDSLINSDGIFSSKNNFIAFKGFSSDLYLGETAVYEKATNGIAATISDSSALKISENGNFIVIGVKNYLGVVEDTYFKNPTAKIRYYDKKDPLKSDATLKEITVNGETINRFEYDETGKYFYAYAGVSDTSETPSVNAIATSSGASVTISPLSGEQTVEIKVVSKDGSNNETYYVYYRNLIEKELPVASVIESFYNYGNLNQYRLKRYGEVLSSASSTDLLQYQLYSIGKDNILVDIESLTGNISNKGNIKFYSYSIDDIDTLINENGAFASGNLFTKFKGYSDKLYLGETGLQSGATTGVTAEMDITNLKVSENGNFIIIGVKDYDSEVTTIDFNKLKVKVKYVEKKDPLKADATLKSITVDGAALEGFNPDVTEYYVTVENEETTELAIEAETNQLNATYTCVKDSEKRAYVITVTPVDGENKIYTIYLRTVYKVEGIAYHSLTGSRAEAVQAGPSNQYGDRTYLTPYQNYIEGYIAYKIPEDKNITLISASIVNAESNMSSSYDTWIDIYQNPHDFDKIYANGAFKSTDIVDGNHTPNNPDELLASYQVTKEYSIPVNTKYPTYYVGEDGIMPLDVSRIKVYDGNVIIVYVENRHGGRSMYLPGTLTVEYIIAD